MKKILTLVLSALMAVGCLFGLTACGKTTKIGSQSGTTGLMYAECLKGCEVAPYDTFALAAQDLKNGRVEYVIIDGATGNSLVKEIEGLKMINVELSSENYAIAVDTKQETLLNQINTVLAIKQLEVAAILYKYMNNLEDMYVPVASAEQNLDAPDTQLVVATNAEFPPFESVLGDKYVGIDIEIAKLIADELGMELVIKDMLFDSVVTSVGLNGIDIGMSGLTVTAERKKSVNFSNTYYVESQYVLTLESNTKLDDCLTVIDVLNVLTANK